MTTEERINQASISELVASNNQPSVHDNQDLVLALSACIIQHSTTAFVVRPPIPNVVATAGVISNPPTQDAISNASQTYPAINVKLQSIFKKVHAPSCKNRMLHD